MDDGCGAHAAGECGDDCGRQGRLRHAGQRESAHVAGGYPASIRGGSGTGGVVRQRIGFGCGTWSDRVSRDSHQHGLEPDAGLAGCAAGVPSAAPTADEEVGGDTE